MLDASSFSILVTLLRDYGLPIAILLAFSWALFTRRLILGSELERKVTQYESELAYRDARRVEERASREMAEQRLMSMTEVMRQHTELLGAIEREVIRGQAGGGRRDSD